eukprot:sb/3464802/
MEVKVVRTFWRQIGANLAPRGDILAPNGAKIWRLRLCRQFGAKLAPSWRLFGAKWRHVAPRGDCKSPKSGNLVAGPANSVKKKHLGHCLPGLESMGKTFPHLGECNEGEFYFDKHVEGVTLDYVVYPTVQDSIDCMGVFGEAYIYLACLGLCESRGIKCPLKVLQADSCINFEGEMDSALASYGNTTTKIFVLSSSGTTSYVNNYFLCANKNCIPYSKACDLVDDCGDRSDEDICENVFKCYNGDYIQLHSKCDGEFDCTDLSDECNEDCSAEIIDNIGLLAFSFTLGCLAVVANGVIIIKFFFTFGKTKNSSAILNQLLIFFISIGDFCMGLYLVLISSSATYYKAKTGFCETRFEWLTGSVCAALGILSAFGSQIFLISMTILSLSRVVNLRNILVPRNVNRKSVAKFTFMTIMVLSTAILLPRCPSSQSSRTSS